MKKEPKEYKCISCNFLTIHSWVYRKHLMSNKHNEMENSAQETLYDCKYCTKKYRSTSGLRKHSYNCKSKPNVPKENKNLTKIELLHLITELENKLITTPPSIAQIAAASAALPEMPIVPPTTTTINGDNNNNTTTNNINIVINYLNANCKDAMNITDFVKSLVFTKDDIQKFLTDHYDKVISNLLIERLGQLPTTQRPLHCIASTTDASGSFAVKTTEWKQEIKPQLDTHIRDVEDDDEYATMTMPTTIDDIKDKVYDTYEEERKAEPKLARIRDKMMGGGGTEGKIRILNHLMDADTLQLPS